MQPDIEIYLKDASREQVHQWLQQVFARCTPWQGNGRRHACCCDGISVIWYEKAFGSWHSLLLDSSQTPWSNDQACASAACAALGVEIRCAVGAWQEQDGEQDADRWLKFNQQGHQEFVWR